MPLPTDVVSKAYTEDTLSITQSPEFLKMQEEAVTENKNVWRKLALMSQGKKEWDIWMEGYSATWPFPGAQKINKHPIIARTFEDAIRIYKQNTSGHGIDSTIDWDKHITTHKIWGCKLFPTEQEARNYLGDV